MHLRGIRKHYIRSRPKDTRLQKSICGSTKCGHFIKVPMVNVTARQSSCGCALSDNTPSNGGISDERLTGHDLDISSSVDDVGKKAV